MKYDLHIHTKYSPCSTLKPHILLKPAIKKGLDGIAVADHNTIKGSLAVKKLNKNKDFEVIVGEEIKTDKGEILAYYLTEEIEPGNFEEVLEKIKQQNALAVIAHPFTVGITRKKTKINFSKIKNKIDGIETFNARNIFNHSNKKAELLAKKLNLAQIAGSDAHFAFEIQRAVTIFDGALRKAIKNKNTRTQGTNFLAFPIRSLSVFPKLRSFLNFNTINKIF
ncbi:PHP domain-containing protein [Candidatus Woesearchaeota archaeon]|nr:PHP domain-containing protein [Candidatus Woesearchaeota archaeon]